MFLKFGEEKHINDLYHNGTIYMNPIQYFRKFEDNELRGDSYEGVSKIRNLPTGQFEIPAIGYKGNYLAFHIAESYEIILGNIFSLYCISSHGWENPTDFRIDDKVKNFGSHCLMVKDNEKFLSLIENKLKELNYKFFHNFVKYYDKGEVNRQISLFEKPFEFEYQKEFRFYVDTKSTEPLIINIGSLVDIAEIQPSELIIKELKLRRVEPADV